MFKKATLVLITLMTIVSCTSYNESDTRTNDYSVAADLATFKGKIAMLTIENQTYVQEDHPHLNDAEREYKIFRSFTVDKENVDITFDIMRNKEIVETQRGKVTTVNLKGYTLRSVNYDDTRYTILLSKDLNIR